MHIKNIIKKKKSKAYSNHYMSSPVTRLQSIVWLMAEDSSTLQYIKMLVSLK